MGIRGGLSLVQIAAVTGGTGTRVTVQAFADLAAAIDPLMTVEITLGNDAIAYTATWERKPTGFALNHR